MPIPSNPISSIINTAVEEEVHNLHLFRITAGWTKSMPEVCSPRKLAFGYPASNSHLLQSDRLYSQFMHLR